MLNFHAIINLLDLIITALDEGKVALGIFIDFSKAFDTVNHNILIDKLEHYGIRGIAKDWINSYLSERKQYVTYMGTKSTMKTMKCGVPQGSILGPLLFLLYINDLGEIFQNLNPILYADDSNLITTGNNLLDLETTTNQEIPLLLDWLQANRHSLNIKKTHVMIFGKKNTKNRDYIPNIKINGETLDIVDETKFLGIILDSELNWKKHVSYTSKKLAKAIAILSKTRQFFNKKTLLQMYYSFMYPYLTYGNVLWGNVLYGPSTSYKK
jgi:hypothetical protein